MQNTVCMQQYIQKAETWNEETHPNAHYARACLHKTIDSSRSTTKVENLKLQASSKARDAARESAAKLTPNEKQRMVTDFEDLNYQTQP